LSFARFTRKLKSAKRKDGQATFLVLRRINYGI